MSESSHPLVRLAEQAITTYIRERYSIEPPEGLFVEMPAARNRAGVFVSLKQHGQLRGCLGTTEPAHPTLAAEVIHNAVGAATRDPRFPPLEESELGGLLISVDVLGQSEPVQDLAALDPRRYGIIVRSGDRHSVLLPDIEGIESVDEQLATARQKAGLGADDPVDLFRFEVTRYY